MSGKLIVIDGADGAGKTTQVSLLMKKLKKRGYKVAHLDFPVYESFFGRMISDYLDDEKIEGEQAGPYFAGMLYSLDRFEQRGKIHKWLSENKIVILDRYTPANQIHQGARIPNKAKREKFFRWLFELEFNILKIPKPDLVVFLYLPTNLSYALIKERGRRRDIHEKNIEHQRRALQIGLARARKEGWKLTRCFRGNRVLSREEVSELIYKKIQKAIGYKP